MPIMVRVVPRPEFESWLRAAQAEAALRQRERPVAVARTGG
jgi:hypothetical protein